MKGVERRVAFITGDASGIGRGMAPAFLKLTAEVRLFLEDVLAAFPGDPNRRSFEDGRRNVTAAAPEIATRI